MQAYFQLDESIIHLNHAAVAPWPVVTRDAIIAFAEENTRIGSQRYDQWLQTEQRLRKKLATLINAVSTDEIALLKNTSEGLSLIAQGIDFRPGENIVIPKEEFPSNKIVWQALESKGIELRNVSIAHDASPEQLLIDAMDENTRLLSCSSVQYAQGLRLDLNRLGKTCKQNDTLFCVDAIQSLGAVAFDVQACAADFVVADGHKWMCAPEGTALFYCRKEIQGEIQLSQYGWHMLHSPFDFAHDDVIKVADNAQRFECGSPNMLGIAALDASLGLLLDIGIETIQSAVIDKTDYLRTGLRSISDVELLSPDTSGRYAGITTFTKTSADNNRLYQHLQSANVLCACRGGGIRFSPHFHTDHKTIEKATDLVAGFTD